ncbi:Aste57867_20069 [Aphanomyces stellatus]|uniref:Aste57867_20069 protein n=1 Tax=Aphanomyces stellatus TaxID=120398 RepID=A0A485LEQ2_9STRA|nr:hypothetical protein As57867_020003 [Aphanomyces stellatus]VFT96764.1 Aste57867_20069 [Aphanomyces stellatus]
MAKRSCVQDRVATALSPDVLSHVIPFIPDADSVINLLTSLQPIESLDDLDFLLQFLLQARDADIDVWPTLQVSSKRKEAPAVLRAVAKYYSRIEVIQSVDLSWLHQISLPPNTTVHVTGLPYATAITDVQTWYAELHHIPITHITWGESKKSDRACLLPTLPQLTRLTGLTILCKQALRDLLPFVATSHVTELDIASAMSENDFESNESFFGPAMVTHLVQWLQARPVRAFSFAWMDATDPALLLAVGAHQTLKKLSISCGTADTTLPFRHLQVPRALQSLSLDAVTFAIDPRSVECLGSALETSNVSTFRLTDSVFKSKDDLKAFLASLARMPLLTHVVLQGNKIRPADCTWVADMLTAAPRLRSLDLSENAIGNVGVETITKAIPTAPHLHTLRLNEVEVGRRAMANALLKSAMAKPMREIQMTGNPFKKWEKVKIRELIKQAPKDLTIVFDEPST